MCEICSKLTIKTLDRRHWCRFDVFIVTSETISHIILVFPLLTLWTTKCWLAWTSWFQWHLGNLSRKTGRCKSLFLWSFHSKNVLLQNTIFLTKLWLPKVAKKVFLDIPKYHNVHRISYCWYLIEQCTLRWSSVEVSTHWTNVEQRASTSMLTSLWKHKV